MADGRRKDEWSRWALALAMFANANRGENQPPVKPERFDPFSEWSRGRAKRKAIKPPTPDEQVTLFATAIGAKKT